MIIHLITSRGVAVISQLTTGVLLVVCYARAGRENCPRNTVRWKPGDLICK